ncbi:unnamed protein product [Dicrocoelium dendriticum]|nr:unnamed protein product [Dicrocoelium dendriticum]
MGCLNCCKRKEASGNRTVYALRQPSPQLADDVPMLKFCSNEIISSRYTWLSFLPKNLFEQFHNLANIFFATIAVLYMFASAATSIWANLGPLIAIIAISMIKDGVDDLFRHRRDRRINCALFRTLRVDSYAKTIRWSATEAQDIRVGDIVLCEEDRTLPCDMVALCSSHNSTALNVTTANLDGETNVKKLYALTPTQSMYASYAPEKLSMNPVKPRDYYGTLNHLYVRVDCSDPSEEFGKFEGRLTTHGRSHIPLSMKNLVLRGSKLHNTEFVIGLAVYTGRETKLSLNGKQSKRKYSSREARSNIILLCFIFAMIIISIVLTIVFTVMTTQTKDTRWYIPVARQTRWEFVQNVFRYVTIVNYLIPISIIITMEFQQLLIAFFISNDLRMYDEQEDLVAKANSSQLADELGQVEFLFCDKTGTLTQNVMWLSVCAVIDTDKIYDFQQRPAQQTTDSPMPASKILNGGTNVLVSSSSSESDSEYSTIESAGRLKNKYNRLKPDTSPELSRFLTMSALCHTVEAADIGVSESELGVSRTGKYHYEVSGFDLIFNVAKASSICASFELPISLC